MKNLEEQLKKLPRKKLRVKANFKIRIKIYILIAREKFKDLSKIKSSRVLVFNKSVSFSLIIIIVFTSTSMYAYASESVTLGHALYPIKKGIEEAEKGISITDDAKAKVYSKMSERRLDEAMELSEKKEGGVNLVKTINEAAGDMEKHITLIRDSNKILSEDFYDTKIKKLEAVAGNVGMEADEEVIDSVAIILDEIKGYKNKDNEKKEYSAEEVEVMIESVKESLDNEEYREESEKLFKRVEEKFNKAEEAMQEGENKKAEGLIKATEAILNNAKHFIKYEERSINEDERKDDDDKEKQEEVKGIKLKNEIKYNENGDGKESGDKEKKDISRREKGQTENEEQKDEDEQKDESKEDLEDAL